MRRELSAALLGLVLAGCATAASAAPSGPAVPVADHHLHLASPATVEVLTPTPLPAVTAALPAELEALLRRREVKAPATPEFVADLYTRDAVIRSRRGGGWVSGEVNIARALAEYAPGYRLLPVAYEIDGDTGYVAGYFARGERYNATFQFSLRREDGVWRVAVDNTIPNAPVMAPQPATADKLVAELDAAGVRYGVVHSVGYAFASPDHIAAGDEAAEVRAENDWTAGEVARHPERLVGFCGINPLKDYAVREIERCLRLPGMRGVKLHFGNSRVSLRDPEHVRRVRAVFAAANRLKAPVAAHLQELQGYGAEQAEIFLNQILPAAPDVPVQIMHMAGAGPGHHDAAFEAYAKARETGDRRMKNVYVDVASVAVAGSSPESLELVARRLRQFGLDHVLFGSDRMPGVTNEDPGAAWTSFRKLPLTEAEFEQVAGNRAPYLPGR